MTSQLLINEPPLQVLPTLAKTVGLNEAIVLQQVHYWLNPRLNKNCFKEKHWVHNTLPQWERQFVFWSKKTIKRTIANLESSGLLISFVTRSFKKTKYYTLNYELLSRICPSNLHALGLADTQVSDSKTPNSIEPTKNQSFCPQGQNDPIERDSLTSSKGSECPHREGQLDSIDGVKMTPSHRTENTLPPPSSVAARAKKEEEEKIIYFPSKLCSLPVEPCQQMLKIWNQTVQCKLYHGKDAHLTPKRKQLLENLLQTVFCGSLNAWQDYCSLIVESRFLAGNNPTGFNATLDWASVPDNAYKVLEGAIYDKPESITHQSSILSWEAFSEELSRTLPSNPCLLPWLKISVSLAKIMGQKKYNSWFSRVSLKALTETKAVFLVEREITKDYLIRSCSSEIRCAVQAHYPTVKEINFEVIPEGGVA